jgi:GNAT superfamily N-acetyltransferase
MPEGVRAAVADDALTMVRLSEREREEREKLDPEFFRKAEDGAPKQETYFKWQLTQSHVIAVVHEGDGGIDGFAIASLIVAPPVYKPGTTALIDDFAVASPELWDSVGLRLFEAVKSEATRRGAVGIVSICAHKDEPKRDFLRRLGLRIVSEWHFAALKR